MSYRYNNAFVKPGLNTLTSPAPIYTVPGPLYSWGQNNYGQLGLGNRTYYSSPKQVGSLTTWSSISSQEYGFIALRSDGTLWSCGRNDFGQLGLNNITYYSSPKQVGSLTNWLQISASYRSTAAIKTDGTLWTWGRNTYGELGLGDTTNRSSPKQVGSLTNWAYASMGWYAGFAIKTDGTLWALGGWGALGLLGLNNTTNYSSPKQVGSLTTWATVFSSQANIFAIKTDGTLWAWGQNSVGQLGLGNRTNYSSPKQVGSLTTWSKISGVYSAVAVKTDGTLWAWGQNDLGQLGLGNTTNYSSPKQVGSLTNWLIPNAGQNRSTFAIKTDNSLWCWGQNVHGNLGLGNTTNYSSPKQVGSLTNWILVSAGRYSASAIRA